MISFEKVTKVFNKNSENEQLLYNGLNLEIGKGEFVTIIGSNGSGKSTLLNVLCGVVKQDSGDVLLGGEVMNNVSQHQRFKRVSRVYQDPMAGTSPTLTVLENLSLASNKGNLFNFKKAVSNKDMEVYINQLKQLDMGLENKLHVKVGLLSGGQRQALSLLMALMNNPEVLLLDEHTAALDPKSSEAIMKLTDKMIKERDITTIMVTHNLNHALQYGNRLIMFHSGSIIYDVSGREKADLSRDRLVKLFIEADETFAEELI